MKLFTEEDVIKSGFSDGTPYNRISLGDYHKELVNDPPAWMKQGLQETASGYGRKLNTGHKINFCGKLYRLYATCFSNVASVWFVTKGRKIFVD